MIKKATFSAALMAGTIAFVSMALAAINSSATGGMATMPPSAAQSASASGAKADLADAVAITEETSKSKAVAAKLERTEGMPAYHVKIATGNGLQTVWVSPNNPTIIASVEKYRHRQMLCLPVPAEMQQDFYSRTAVHGLPLEQRVFLDRYWRPN